ncbi:MAG: 2-oxoacid dehydrogenases acyltransferase-domain-containing protein [Benjaminiella poitrasii]|nr:MAG: 2-oxoacid dehydrogenases acyltransferase-domain-containing protein [Benjaminiella poitrasii]
MIRFTRSLKHVASTVRYPSLKRPQYNTSFIRQYPKPLFLTHVPYRAFHYSSIQQITKPFLLADIGEGITECEIIQWFVEPGSVVAEFDKICEVQSDKASVEISSRFAGKVLKLHYDVNDIAKVGEPLVDIEATEDEDTEEGDVKHASQPEVVNSKQEEEEETPMSERSDMFESRAGSILATPAVRRLAKEKGIDLTNLKGSGKDGRILKEDILDKTEKVVTQATAGSISHQQGATISPLTMIQKAMFKSMTKSLDIPQLGYGDEIEMDAVRTYRASLNKHIASHPTLYAFPKVTYMPIFVKCLSMALAHYPIMNAQLIHDGDVQTARLAYRPEHHIGIAMDTKDGLIVPNIKNVQVKSIFEIANEIHRLTELASKSAIGTEDLRGGTITISNIGTIGGTYANPVIVSSELAIVALGRIQRVPRFDENDRVVAKEVMPISWSADHRVIDGATIARFGNYWKRLIENPALLASELR